MSEFCGGGGDDDDAAPPAVLMLQPIVAAGHSVGVFGTMHTKAIDAADEEQRMVSFTSQISILLNNCQMFQKAKQEQEKIKTKIALLEQLKSIGSQVRHGLLKSHHIYKCDLFTKTGSKQTQGKRSNRSVVRRWKLPRRWHSGSSSGRGRCSTATRGACS
eukprot:COSAG06_NODE_4552_length_4154_cov_41.030567_3_plen_160_part_00